MIDGKNSNSKKSLIAPHSKKINIIFHFKVSFFFFFSSSSVIPETTSLDELLMIHSYVNSKMTVSRQ